jgi:hypothetical protein
VGKGKLHLIFVGEEVNRVMADSLNFAYLPGDNADHGGIDEYELVRQGLDQTQFALVRDRGRPRHSSEKPRQFQALHDAGGFLSVRSGILQFLALDAFASNDPRVFDISEEQLHWPEQELELIAAARQRSVSSFTAIQAN